VAIVSEKRLRGRPPAPVPDRLEKLLGQPLLLDRWPIRDLPCWFGPTTVSIAGRTSTTTFVRACFIAKWGDHPSWIYRRTFCVNLKCVNPHHFRPDHQRLANGTPLQAYPPEAYAYEIAEQNSAPVSEDDEIPDVIDTIYSIDEGRTMTPDQLAERFKHIYTPAQFELAQALIREKCL
jgi:hypothetical protein